ncbi:hypothetical protein NDU88_001843 [Pleurodeles waltl]|uniref:Uncharacterized protein n=1 Tax=Pleurodeles waltl TaxID=8319 RepID=A0AAV7R8E2_PLEWA|nr:hypothetical protein NDU88_001843 [Pleurodeles waltl]
MNLARSLFAPEICSEIVSLKTDLKSCIKDIKRYVTEHTVDARSEDQEILWWHMATLEEHHIKLQAKQEDLENPCHCNNICMRGVPKGEERSNMPFRTALLKLIRGDDDAPPPVLDKALLGGICIGSPQRGS